MSITKVIKSKMQIVGRYVYYVFSTYLAPSVRVLQTDVETKQFHYLKTYCFKSHLAPVCLNQQTAHYAK